MIEENETLKTKEAYIGYAQDELLRASSTSGGICQCISRYIIQQGGVVSGIYLDQDFCARRGFARTFEELEPFNKSKYIEARQGGSYREIQNLVKEGQTVLFVGTPCHVRGLRSFLEKSYPNLYCMDFVCLGIPSEKIWRSYLKSICKGRKLETIDFKDKISGWKNFSFHAVFSDGTEILEPGRENAYMKAVIGKVISRPSCYHCTCRTFDRDSDLTVSDAWGTETLAPELFDERGTSAVMVNTDKGGELLQTVKRSLRLKEVDPGELWQGNLSAWKQFDMPKARKQFYTDTYQHGFDYAFRRWERSLWLKKCLVGMKQIATRTANPGKFDKNWKR